MLVDSHCHLNFPQFEGRAPELIERMTAAGVGAALTVCTTLEEFPAVLALAEQSPRLWCSVGVHPDNTGVAEPTVDDLVRLADHPKVIAIGETGLDYYRTPSEQCDWQRLRFSVHIEAARRTRLPMIIHTRSSAADTVQALKDQGRADVRGVMHCFTETLDVAKQAVELGFMISMSGIVTFKNAETLREVARWVPDDMLLVETDAPYLAPVPYRGKTNEPAFVRHVAECVARERGQSLQRLAEQTSANFFRLFEVNPPDNFHQALMAA